MKNNKTYETFAYVDGFNQYLSLVNHIKTISEYKGTKSGYSIAKINKLKWNNLRKLIGFFNGKIEDEDKLCIKYFTAEPTYIKDEKKLEEYEIRKLILQKYCKVKIYNGYFKESNSYNKDGSPHHEEKQSDVNLAVQVIADFYRYKPKKIIIVSNDTDFVPVIKNLLENNENTNSKIILLTPYGSKHAEEYSRKNHEFTENKDLDIYKITLQNMEDSALPYSIEIEGKTYLNPYV